MGREDDIPADLGGERVTFKLIRTEVRGSPIPPNDRSFAHVTVSVDSEREFFRLLRVLRLMYTKRKKP